MALPIIPTDINGANRFNQFDPSIMGLILKTTNNDALAYDDPRAAKATRCDRHVAYWEPYPGDYESVSARMGAPHSNVNKNMIIGKLTGFWMFKEYLGLSLSDTFKTWTVMESIVGVTGLAGVLLLSAVV